MIYILFGGIIAGGIGYIAMRKTMDETIDHVVKHHGEIVEQGKMIVRLQEEIMDLYAKVEELKVEE